ncbi:hypothetical protein ABH902_000051 [Enterococcus sp. UD-01]|jgi:hypothetical protein
MKKIVVTGATLSALTLAAYSFFKPSPKPLFSYIKR